MFESLDEHSPSRMPEPDSRGPGPVARLVSTAIFILGVIARHVGDPSVGRRWLAYVLMGGAVVVFGVFQYRAYQDRKSGPIDLKL